MDVLIYPGIGMESLSYQLASLSTCANPSVASWGHPETSGLPTLDYYLSGDSFEPPDDGVRTTLKSWCGYQNFGAYVEPLEPRVTNVSRS